MTLIDVKTNQVCDTIQLPGGQMPDIPVYDGVHMWVGARNGQGQTQLFKLLAPR